MKQSNLASYVSQLKVQRYNKSKEIQDLAVDLLSLINKRIELKLGRKLASLSGQELNQIPFDINGKTKEHKDFWGNTAMFSYEESAHFLGFFGKKHRDKRKKFFKSIGKAVGNVGKLVAKIVAAPMYAPLLPFQGAMKRKLQAKGIKPKKGILKLAEQFYSNIIKHYDYAGYEGEYAHIEGQDEKADVVPLATIIPAIISFFKMIFKKKEDGTATEEDKAIISDVEQEQTRIDKDPEYHAQLLSENSIANSQKGISPIMWIVIMIFGVVILKKVM